MTMTKVDGRAKVTLSRCNTGEVRLEVIDSASGAVIELLMSTDELGTIITGLARVEVDSSARNLERWGKTRIIEARKVTLPHAERMTRAEMEAYLRENCQEDGYILRASLSSQHNVVREGGLLTLNYSVERYV